VPALNLPGSGEIWSKKVFEFSPSALLLSSPSPSSDVHFRFVRAISSYVKWDITKWKPPGEV